MTTLEVVQAVALSRGLVVQETVKVPTEDAYNTEGVKHVCKQGVSSLSKHHESFNVPTPSGSQAQMIACTLWNCSYCGKTYYAIEKETVSY